MIAVPQKKTITLRLPSPHSGGQEKLLYWTLDHPLAQVLVCPSGVKTGKALCLNTIIPTPDGYRTMGSLEVGDYVYDEHGKPVLITFATDPMYGHNCCEVEFSDGSKIIADEGHLWAIEHFQYGLGIRTTGEIKETLHVYSPKSSSTRIKLLDNGIPELGLEKPEDDYVYIMNIRSVKSVPVKCIRVDSPTHLFLAGESCIPTHNTYGSSLWMITEVLSTPGLFCVWIAPTYLKCKIAYRYFKNFLPQDSSIQMMDGLLEIRFGNGSFVKFMHGRDAETTIEGEAVDRFVVDEAGKILKQVWISLTTTITQTRGKGIVTGTPRGLTWYYDITRQALKMEDPFFCYASMKTEDSPFVTKEAIARAKKLLPPHLFAQYYLAEFISHSSTFGNLDLMWDESCVVRPNHEKFWLAGEDARKDEIIHGVDIAKKQDFTVFYSVNTKGYLVGFCRFQHVPYPQQVIRLKTYLTNYFGSAENTVKFDATGVGVSFEDMLEEAQLEASLIPVSFTSKSKSEMITKAVLAIQSGWHKTPRLKCIAHEFAVYELNVTSTGLHKYGAPDGEHDDVVSAAILAISSAYVNSSNTENEKLLEAALRGESLDDIIGAYSQVLYEENDIFVKDDDEDYDDGKDLEIDEEND